jgi:uncharacterized membrane protein YkgB
MKPPQAIVSLPRFVASIADAAERRLRRWMARHGLSFLRIGLGVIYVWFGALKLVPGLSPAEGLVTALFPSADPRWLVPALASWEMAIGLGLMFGVLMRLTLLCVLGHMAGTLLPLLFLRSATFRGSPLALTLEGQYIVKNVVLIGAALVLGGASSMPRHRARARDGVEPADAPVPSSR